MTADDILNELSKMGSDGYKRIFRNHGAPDSTLGVKVEDLKKIQKKVKTDHALALALYDTGVPDAQYLAGLIADPPRMTRAQLRKWAKTASWHMVSEYTVAWVASESRFGAELAHEWIDSKNESVAAVGWSTFGSLVGIKPDEEVDRAEVEKLLSRVQREIHTAPNRVRYTMNGFVIAVGCFVAPLAAKAKAVAKAVGPVEVDMGGTACQVPDALAYIEKVETAGRQGKKRKSARC